MARKIERIQYGGWPNCFRVSNGKIELIVTGDVGPRISASAAATGCGRRLKTC